MSLRQAVKQKFRGKRGLEEEMRFEWKTHEFHEDHTKQGVYETSGESLLLPLGTLANRSLPQTKVHKGLRSLPGCCGLQEFPTRSQQTSYNKDVSAEASGKKCVVRRGTSFLACTAGSERSLPSRPQRTRKALPLQQSTRRTLGSSQRAFGTLFFLEFEEVSEFETLPSG